MKRRARNQAVKAAEFSVGKAGAALPGVIVGEGYRPNTGASLGNPAMTSWRPQPGSADADMLLDLTELVPRSRDLDRNNGIARGILTTKVDNVVGTGLRLAARPDYRALGWTAQQASEWSRNVESKWKAWWWSTACHAGDTLTGDQLTQQIFRSQLLNGAALALPLWIPDRGDGFATKLQTVESDRLRTPYGMADTATMRNGIQFDDYGAPIGYWILKIHPGDVYRFMYIARPEDFEFIPRYTDFGRKRVLHIFASERSGQTTGKPLFSSILNLFKQVDRYTEAELAAAVANSMIAMTIETPLEEASILELFNGDHDQYLAARRQSAVAMSSGKVMPLFPGDKMSPFIPGRPATEFGAFTENIYRIIGCGTDLPYEWVTRNWTQSNYSSQRAALLEVWRAFTRERDNLGTQWMDPCYQLFMEEQVDAGNIDAPGFYDNKLAYLRCRWIGPGRGWVDPTKEAQAAQLRMQIQVSTLEDECAEQGKDWRDVYDQLAVEQLVRDELNLSPIPQQTEIKQILAPGTPGAPDKGLRTEPNTDPNAEGSGTTPVDTSNSGA